MERPKQYPWRLVAGGLALATATLLALPAQAKEDPMRPPVWTEGPAATESTAPASKELELNLILRAADRRVAVINGQRLAVGDRIQGLRVAMILEDRVRLTGRAGPRLLRLGSGDARIQRTLSKRTSDAN